MKKIKKFNEVLRDPFFYKNDVSIINIYLVEVTNNGKWEMNHGFYLVKATSETEARSIIEKNILSDEDIVNITTIEQFMGDKNIQTIIQSQEM
jgi:hypothetical protein